MKPDMGWQQTLGEGIVTHVSNAVRSAGVQ